MHLVLPFEVEYILLLSKDLNYISVREIYRINSKSRRIKNENLKLILKIEEDINKRKIDK